MVSSQPRASSIPISRNYGKITGERAYIPKSQGRLTRTIKCVIWKRSSPEWGILSYWISKSVLVPLKKLSLGTKGIREGNLDTGIEYTKPDEFGAVCRDFDEMRAYLKDSVEQRLKDEQRKKDLIIGISHDLRTPLTSISGYLDGLMEGIANTPEKRQRYLAAIKTRARDLSGPF